MANAKGNAKPRRVSLADFDKRLNEISTYEANSRFGATAAYVRGVETALKPAKAGGKPKDFASLGRDEREGIARAVYKTQKDSFVDFIGGAGVNFHGRGFFGAAYEDRHPEARAVDTMLKNGFTGSAIDGAAEAGLERLTEPLREHVFSDADTNIGGLARELAAKAKPFGGFDPKKIKSPQEIALIYQMLGGATANYAQTKAVLKSYQ